MRRLVLLILGAGLLHGGCASRVTPLESAANPPTLIDRRALFGNPARTLPQISPDGRYVSWVAPDAAGVRNLWVAPTADLNAGFQLTQERERPVRDYYWTYQPGVLVYPQDTDGDENHHAYKVDVTSRTVVDLTPLPAVQAQIYDFSARRPGTIVLGLNDRDPRHHDLYEVDLETGARTLLVTNEEGFLTFTLDRDLRVRFAERLDSDGSLRVMQRSGNGWLPYDQVPADDQLTTATVGLSITGDQRYLVDSRGRDTAALVIEDLATKQQRVLAEDPRTDVAGVLLHPREYTVQAVRTEWDLPRWTVIDQAIAPDVKALAALGPSVEINARTLDDSIWVVTVQADAASPKTYLWRRESQTAQLWFVHHPALDALPLVKQHPRVIKARDGLDLMSYLSLPVEADPDGDGRPSHAVPLVLLVHGGPWARDSWGLSPVHQMLANRGYAVLSVNFRGSTGFGKRFINAADQQWAKAMHTDLVDAVGWAVQAGVAQADKVAIVGASYGGYSALVGVTMTPDLFACAVDNVGPSNLLTLLASMPAYWTPLQAMFYRRIGDPTTLDGQQLLATASPLNFVDNIKRPLLVIHGANDPRVKRAESDQIVRAMKARRIPVSYVLLSDEGHGAARPANRLAVTAAIEAFLATHLGGRFQPVAPADLKDSSIEVLEGRAGLPGF